MCQSRSRLAANNHSTFALIVAIGLVGMVAVQVSVPVREIDAKVCINAISFNASEGRCFPTWLGEEVGIGP